MKCPNCGAEIENGKRVCKFCGAQITAEMQKEQELLNKEGCPKCGSTNVAFEREKQGEVKNKKGTAVILKTVGVCKDCGHTWNVENSGTGKKRKTWLWVLGWIFIFPVPLTILMLRPNNKLDKKVRIGIIVAAWIVYAIWMIWGNRSNKTGETAARETTAAVVAQETTAKSETTEKPMTEAETTTAEPTTKAETTAVETTGAEEEAKDPGTVDPELKAFLDSYEACMDEYCEFMEDYDASDVSQLLNYTQMLTKYQEFAEAAEAYDADELTGADQAYYLEVTTRVNTKLLKAANK